MEQIGIGMITVGAAGILGGVMGKMIYKAFGIDELMIAVCWMIIIIGMALTLIVTEQ